MADQYDLLGPDMSHPELGDEEWSRQADAGLIGNEDIDAPAPDMMDGVDSVPPTPEQVQTHAMGWRDVLNRSVADKDAPLMYLTMASVLGKAAPGVGRGGKIAEAARQGLLAKQGAQSARTKEELAREAIKQKGAYTDYLHQNLGIRQGELDVKRQALDLKKANPPKSAGVNAGEQVAARNAAYVKIGMDSLGLSEPEAKKWAAAAVAPARTPQEADDAIQAAVQRAAITGSGTDITNPLAPPDPLKMAKAADEAAQVSQSIRRAGEFTKKLKAMGYNVTGVDYKAQTITFLKPDGSSLTKSYAEQQPAPAR